MSVPATSSSRPSEEARSSEGTRRAGSRGRFEEALARARGRGTPERRPSPSPRPSARGALEERPRDPGGATAGAAPTAHTLDPPGICELQAALRAAPPAIAAAARQGAPQLALEFGSALSIDLRTGAQGLELSLRPAPALARAARAELPRLVEVLRARGLRVARADVRANPLAAGTSRAR